MRYTTAKPSNPSIMLPPGEYTVRVIEAKEDTSKSGNDMLKLKFRVIKSNGTEGPALFDNLVFTESSLWKVDQFLDACGQHPGEGVDFDLDPQSMVGWECKAKLKHDTYQGNTNLKVDAFIVEEF
jgi:hypothetical protein